MNLKNMRECDKSKNTCKQQLPIVYMSFNPLNAELNPICHLLALLGGATIVVVSRLRVKVGFRKCHRRPQHRLLLVCELRESGGENNAGNAEDKPPS